MDIIKHYEIFNPEKALGNSSVMVIGVGAVGSQVAIQLAKLGCKNILLVDDDKVEGHNVANQLFGVEDIGSAKGEACAKWISRAVGEIPVSYYLHKLSPDTWGHFARTMTLIEMKIAYAFVCVDSMSARKNLAELLPRANVNALFETRMNSYSGMVYAVDPFDSRQMEDYRETLYADEDVLTERQACGTIPSIISTANIVASLAVDTFIKWSMRRPVENEIIFDLTNLTLTHRQFRRSV